MQLTTTAATTATTTAADTDTTATNTVTNITIAWTTATTNNNNSRLYSADWQSYVVLLSGKDFSLRYLLGEIYYLSQSDNTKV